MFIDSAMFFYVPTKSHDERLLLRLARVRVIERLEDGIELHMLVACALTVMSIIVLAPIAPLLMVVTWVLIWTTVCVAPLAIGFAAQSLRENEIDVRGVFGVDLIRQEGFAQYLQVADDSFVTKVNAFVRRNVEMRESNPFANDGSDEDIARKNTLRLEAIVLFLLAGLDPARVDDLVDRAIESDVRTKHARVGAFSAAYGDALRRCAPAKRHSGYYHWQW